MAVPRQVEVQMGEKLRGFQLLTPERRREIASMGGKATTSHGFSDPEVCARASALGGAAVPAEKRAFARDRELAAAAGRKGGSRRKHG